MSSSDLLKSISETWPFSFRLVWTDDGHFIIPKMSDDGSHGATSATQPETQASSSGLSTLMKTRRNRRRARFPSKYRRSVVDGYDGDNEDDGDSEDDGEQIHEPSDRTDSESSRSVSEGDSSDDEPQNFRVPGAFEVTDDEDGQTLDHASSHAAMMENENLESQLVTRNPWRTLAKFRNPMKQEELGRYSRFPILRMPAELLLVVAEHLPAESVACLALACKTTYMALGTLSFKMSKPDLWKFLLLIEHERQSSYACSRCLTLHRPPESNAPVSRCGRYSCCNSFNWLRPVEMRTHLPDSFTPGLVKLIGRKYFEDPRACQEYLSWAMMSTKKTSRYIKIATHVIPQMLDGSLVLRTETYIHPFYDGQLTERSVLQLTLSVGIHFKWGLTSFRVPDLCAHHDWKSYLTNLVALKESIQPTNCVSDDENHHHKTRCYSNERIIRATGQTQDYPIEICDLIHEQPCTTWKLEVSSTTHRQPRKACRPKLEDTYDGEIKGCKKCTTDFCISACKVPDVGYCLVFSTWKDIGGVGPGLADKWDHHVRAPRRLFETGGDEVRSEDQVGQAYAAFEKVERSGLGTPQRYSPQPDRKMVRDLTRRVRKHAHKKDDTTDTDGDTDSEEEDNEGSL